MSYSEQNGQVVLTMSREDWQLLLFELERHGIGLLDADRDSDELSGEDFYRLLNRLNAGNPNYTPYQVEEKS